MELTDIIESILFASAKPLATKEILNFIQTGAQNPEQEIFKNTKEADIATALQDLKLRYHDRPFFLQEAAEKWCFATHPQYAEWVRCVSNETKPQRLTQAALETLAVIAYRQPITRAEIEAVRGVGVGGVLDTLLERQVVRIAGRADVPGKPLLYETTQLFLQHFGLNQIGELPNMEELKRVDLPTAQQLTKPDQPELIHESATATQTN